MLLNTNEADFLLTYKPKPVLDDPSVIFEEPPSRPRRVGYSMNVENLFTSSVKEEALKRMKSEI